MTRILAALALVALVAGCSQNTSESDSSNDVSTISKDDLEDKVTDTISFNNGTTFTVNCEGDLAEEDGETQDCMIEADTGEQVGMRVTSDGGDGEIQTQPFIPAEDLADGIKGDLEGQGHTVESVTCDDDLIGKVDETADCDYSMDGADGTVEAHVNSVDGLAINFEYADKA